MRCDRYTASLLSLPDCYASLVESALATTVHRPDYDSRERLAIEMHKALSFGMGFGDL
eukprot:COSAG02_NODE_8260_length_2639_cov_1.019291_2_plen_58_part_00